MKDATFWAAALKGMMSAFGLLFFFLTDVADVANFQMSHMSFPLNAADYGCCCIFFLLTPSMDEEKSGWTDGRERSR